MDYLKISRKISDMITYELNYDEDKKEIITYSIEMIILQVFGFILIIPFAYLLNSVKPAIVAALFGAILRKVSGGAHFDSPLKCLFFGAIVYSVLGAVALNIVKFPFWTSQIIYLMLIICFIIVGIFAPVDSLAKPIHSKSFKRKLKLSSLIFIILSLFIIFSIDMIIYQTSIVLGLMYQSMTLLPIFNDK